MEVVPTRGPRRTKAQVAQDLMASGRVGKGKPTPAEVQQSLVASKARTQPAEASVSGSTAQTSVTAKTPRRGTQSQPIKPSAAPSVTPGRKATASSPNFELPDYEEIVTNLSRPQFRNAIFGGGVKTKVTGQGTKVILNNLAIQLNNNYNQRNTTTKMRLTGRQLQLRLQQYKGKYMATKRKSLSTGFGVTDTEQKRGLSIEGKLEEMCPLYSKMDAIFKDKGNVNAFGIMDSGVNDGEEEEEEAEEEEEEEIEEEEEEEIEDEEVQDEDEDVQDEDLDVQDEDLDVKPQVALFGAKEIVISDSEEDEELLKIKRRIEGNTINDNLPDLPLMPPPPPLSYNQSTAKPQKPQSNQFTQNPKSSQKSSQKTPNTKEKVISKQSEASTSTSTSTSATRPKRKRATPAVRRKRAHSAQLTPAELALDDSDLENKGGLVEEGSSMAVLPHRGTLAGRQLDPLPSIDPSTVRTREHKHPVAAALQNGNDVKMSILKDNSDWRHLFEERKLAEELRLSNEKKSVEASKLEWAREQYYHEHKESQEKAVAEKKLEEARERSQVAKDLALGGKSPEEVRDYLNVIFPKDQ